MSKKLEKPFVYKREYDLTGYDVDILQKYQLEQAIYIYVGSSCAYNIKARSSKWRYHIKTNNSSICHTIRNFIHNLELFYKRELRFSDNIIDDKLYYSNVVEFEEFETLEKARDIESVLIGQYQFLDSVNHMLKQKIILLSNNDSMSHMVKSGSKASLKIKNKYIEKHKNKPIMRYHINYQFNTDGSFKSITQEFEPILELNKKNTLSRPSRVFSK
ncbi:TPA: hypothetical protein KON80_003668 [Clostridioides difficile]|nr:hypothetical protein [Clostridioides difficile]MDN9367450.1 hypothetical protein [Clostridioides difficile]MDO0030519.1 hypothetical protein [Clostridioides difficile]HBE9457360.1 hypothetical protein [Clostridioides difficile]HBF4471633.1 hypothetical protein [Clostridioides difficile]